MLRSGAMVGFGLLFLSEIHEFFSQLRQKLQAPLNKERQPQVFVMTKQHAFTPVGRAVFKGF
jgi:hypothetical protein